jgi:membrane-associated phospholipid phosphatase
MTPRRALEACALIVTLATPAAAQVGPDTPIRNAVRLESPTARTAADWLSTGLVIASLVLPCAVLNRSWRCATNQALQVGTGIVTAEVTKHVVHRTRPNGHDNKSWFSEHTMLACLGDLQSTVFAICPAVGLLRLEADQHYSTDVAGGFAAAVLIHTTVGRWRRR